MLCHTVGVDGPNRKLVCIQGELFLHTLDDRTVNQKEYLHISVEFKGSEFNKRPGEKQNILTYSSISALKHAQLLLSGGVLIRRDHGLEGSLGDVPHLVMLFKGRRGVEDSLANDLLNLLAVDR